MNQSVKRILSLKSLLVIGCIGVLSYLAYLKQVPGSETVWYSILPPLVAVGLALVTHQIFLSLIASIVLGGLLFKGSLMGVVQAGQYVVAAFSDFTNLQILFFVVFVITMISLMIQSGGMQGVVNGLLKFAKTRRSTQLTAVIMGIAFFIDDYANTMLIGSAMRPMTDKMKISREKLAFLVDATAAPIAGIAIVSTWIGYEVGLFEESAKSLGIALDGYSLFFDALGFRFYCWLMIIFVIMNAWSGRDFGPMAKAEKRAFEQGKLEADDARPLTQDSMKKSEPLAGVKIHALTALLPLFLLFSFLLGGLWIDGGGSAQLKANSLAVFSLTAWRVVFSTSQNSILLLSASALLGLVSCIILSLSLSKINLSQLMNALFTGFKASLLPCAILVLAWSLKGACDSLQTGIFLSDILKDSFSPLWFPLVLFLVAGLTAFSTGTSWGTMAILIPTAIPVAFSLDGSTYGLITMISLGAVLDGAIFGDHCSPISDTTIMSSISSACDHIHHVKTQLPYSLTVGMVALFCGYLPAAAGYSSALSILSGTLVLAVIFFILGKKIKVKV